MTKPIPTRVAHAEWGDNRFAGYSVANELAGRESWLGIVALGVTGRRFSAEERGLLDDLGVVLTVADPHIWPLKLTRVAAAYGSTLAALAAGALALDEARIGHFTTGEAARFLQALRQNLGGPDDRAGIEAACRAKLSEQGRLLGFGVPFRPIDERVTMLAARLEARGRDRLEYWTLFTHVADVMFGLKGLRANMTLAAAAACLDLGLDARETAILVSFLGLSDFLVNAAEGAKQAPASLQRLPDASVRYVGPPPRSTGRNR